MRLRPLLAFLLLLALLLGSEALTAKEETAVREFMGAFPVLASASPPWLNASDACNNPPFYGLSCSNDTDPHILGLYELLENPTVFAFEFPAFAYCFSDTVTDDLLLHSQSDRL